MGSVRLDLVSKAGDLAEFESQKLLTMTVKDDWFERRHCCLVRR